MKVTFIFFSKRGMQKVSTCYCIYYDKAMEISLSVCGGCQCYGDWYHKGARGDKYEETGYICV